MKQVFKTTLLFFFCLSTTLSQAHIPSNYQHEEYNTIGWVKWEFGNKGHLDETVRHTEITAGGDIRIAAANGVIVEYKQDGTLNDSINALSQLPELAWMAELRSRDDIDWQAIDEVHDQWQEHEEGFGGPGVTLIALAVAVAVPGLGTNLLGLGKAAAAGTLTAVQAAQIAVIDTLVSKAITSLVVNGGDIGAVFKELISTEGLLTLATAGLTAGITNSLYTELGIPLAANTELSSLAPDQLIKKALIDSAIKTGLDTAIYGADPLDSLLTSLQTAAVTTLGAKLSNEIGKAYYDGDINKALQLIAQGAVGCGLGAGTGGDCGSGAAGAVIGEVVGEAFLEQQLANAGIASLTDLSELRTQGINVAQLSAGLVVALAGGDINSATLSAGIVAQENATKLIVSLGKVILKLGKTFKEKGKLTGKDILDSPYTELVGFVDDVNTLLDPDAGTVEKGIAILSIATGIDKQTIDGASSIIAKASGKVGPNRTALIDNLVKGGTKITPADVVDIRKLSGGRTVWLEKGSDSGGLQHIYKHVDEFAGKGIPKNQIPDAIFTALDKGKVVGYQGKGTGRPIYEYQFNGKTQRTAITVGDNGFIVGANPK